MANLPLSHTLPTLIYEDKKSAAEAEKLLSWFKEELDYHLKAFLSEKREEAEEVSPEAADLVNEIERFVFSGGRRVRPAFMYSGYVAGGGRAHEAALFACMAPELLHTFALIHDDIIDRSDIRRGKPTSYKAFERLHKAKKLLGDSRQFGLSAAILAGDLAATLADEVLTIAPFPQERLRRARWYFDQMKSQVIEGEYLDVLGGYKEELSEEEVLNTLEYKTAKYTVERPLQIGAVLAGAETDLLEILTAYAIPLGQSFQLQDDVLGVFGDPETTGKSAESDIREGKKTVLIAKAYEWATLSKRRVLNSVLGNSSAKPQDIEKVRQIIYEVGAYDYSVKLSRKLVEQAKIALSTAKLNEEGRGYLLAAANYLLNRI